MRPCKTRGCKHMLYKYELTKDRCNVLSKVFHSGFVTIAGRPNVGKSTLMNCILGEKLAIVSNKPQTTRNKIQGILTREDFQAVFIDTPGIHTPKSKLGASMVKMAESAASEVDCILFLVEPHEKPSDSEKKIAAKLAQANVPVFLVINKIDTVTKAEVLPVIDAYKEICKFAEIIPISALRAENIDELLDTVRRYLPPGPKYFPEDMITDRPERFIAAEMIREKALYVLQEEVPHGIAVEIMSVKTRDGGMVDLDATIYCERDSHKGIVIGKRGATLKEIGSQARRDLERLFGAKVNLQLWVRVKKGWRDSDFYIKNFGYDNE